MNAPKVDAIRAALLAIPNVSGRCWGRIHGVDVERTGEIGWRMDSIEPNRVLYTEAAVSRLFEHLTFREKLTHPSYVRAALLAMPNEGSFAQTTAKFADLTICRTGEGGWMVVKFDGSPGYTIDGAVAYIVAHVTEQIK